MSVDPISTTASHSEDPVRGPSAIHYLGQILKGETTPAISLAISRKGRLERCRNDPSGSNESTAYAWPHCLRSKRSVVRIHSGVPHSKGLNSLYQKGEYTTGTQNNGRLAVLWRGCTDAGERSSVGKLVRQGRSGSLQGFGSGTTSADALIA